jgi:hypothetical protein
MAKAYTVHAQWDAKNQVWWTNGEDIVGLTCQGDTFDELAEVVFELGPELLRDNRVEQPGTTISITVATIGADIAVERRSHRYLRVFWSSANAKR